MTTPTPAPLLDIRDLSVTFRTRSGTVHAVDRLSLTVGAGQTVGIVGESGSGKTVSMMSVLKLVRDPSATITGQVLYKGRDLRQLGDRALRHIRGSEIAMIFQDPMTALTPVYRVGWQIVEQIRAHEKVTRRAARARAIDLFKEVGIPAPERRVDAFPHELSGGMRQRAMIAMALASEPALLIADEPTTALDVTTQAQVLDLMLRLRERHGASLVIITHDIGVISEVADEVLVMYGGRIVERGTLHDVLRNPQHPYTWGLLAAIPRADSSREDRLVAIPGSPVSAGDVPEGCPFAPRCQFRFDKCLQRPPLTADPANPGHLDACWLPREGRPEQRDKILVRRSSAPTPDDEAR